ncbi:hypothetical protein SSP35_59_00030 [Streptomyces sp. NBRC 110611]|nr:hypothetical protein SSP35_59_00030 [Streptomyces sp. NBRC 110611]
MARKGWNDLSPDYRRRLERAGIGQIAYAAGVDLSVARGHKETPERPTQAERWPERYAGYTERRSRRQRTTRALTVERGEIFITGLRSADWRKVSAHWSFVDEFFRRLRLGTPIEMAVYVLRHFNGPKGRIGGYRQAYGGAQVPVYHLVTDPNVLLRWRRSFGAQIFRMYDDSR